MLVIGAGYGVYALSLLLQPARWSRTPAYRNLLAVLPAHEWGICFAAVSAVLFAAVGLYGKRWLSVTALTAAAAITVPWTLAFLVRWATNDATTPETWVSWGVNAYLIARAATLLDYREVLVSRRDGGQDDDG
jgi:drug/metabolite transporter (DMT)-like permease